MTDMTRPTPPDLSCDDVRELAASFVLGALEPDQADAVRAHLASCADAHIGMAELDRCCQSSLTACRWSSRPRR